MSTIMLPIGKYLNLFLSHVVKYDTIGFQCTYYIYIYRCFLVEYPNIENGCLK